MKKQKTILTTIAILSGAFSSALAIHYPAPIPVPTQPQVYQLVGESLINLGILQLKQCHYRSETGATKTTQMAKEDTCPKTITDRFVIRF